MALKVELGGRQKNEDTNPPLPADSCYYANVIPIRSASGMGGSLQVFQSRCHSWPLTPCPSYWLVLWRNGTLFDIWDLSSLFTNISWQLEVSCMYWRGPGKTTPKTKRKTVFFAKDKFSWDSMPSILERPFGFNPIYHRVLVSTVFL